MTLRLKLYLGFVATIVLALMVQLLFGHPETS